MQAGQLNKHVYDHKYFHKLILESGSVCTQEQSEVCVWGGGLVYPQELPPLGEAQGVVAPLQLGVIS